MVNKIDKIRELFKTFDEEMFRDYAELYFEKYVKESDIDQMLHITRLEKVVTKRKSNLRRDEILTYSGIKRPKNKKYFSDKDINFIKANTENNNHSVNFEFIAKKIDSKLYPEFKEIRVRRDRIGYLDGSDMDKQYHLFEKLLKELKLKSPIEYKMVNENL